MLTHPGREICSGIAPFLLCLLERNISANRFGTSVAISKLEPVHSQLAPWVLGVTRLDMWDLKLDICGHGTTSRVGVKLGGWLTFALLNVTRSHPGCSSIQQRHQRELCSAQRDLTTRANDPLLSARSNRIPPNRTPVGSRRVERCRGLIF